MVSTKSTGKSAQKSAPKARASNPDASLQLQLRAIAAELRCALSTITVATHALRRQNAEIDADVALTLQRGASAPVHAGLERVEALLVEPRSAGETVSEFASAQSSGG
jgi:hypothetical protein